MSGWPPQSVSGLAAIWWPRAQEWSWSHVPLLLVFFVRGWVLHPPSLTFPQGKSHFLAHPHTPPPRSFRLILQQALGVRLSPLLGLCLCVGCPVHPSGTWAAGHRSATASKRQVSKDKVLRHAYLSQTETARLGTKISYDVTAVRE